MLRNTLLFHVNPVGYIRSTPYLVGPINNSVYFGTCRSIN